MTKTELIDKVAAKTKLTKKASAKAIDAMVEAIKGSLSKGNKVQLIGFGSFDVKKERSPQWPQSANRQSDQDCRSQSTGFQSW